VSRAELQLGLSNLAFLRELCKQNESFTIFEYSQKGKALTKSFCLIIHVETSFLKHLGTML